MDSTVIASFAAAGTSGLSSVIAIIVLLRTVVIGRQLNVTHDLVNGQSKKLDAAIASSAFKAGQAAGVEVERTRKENLP